MKVKKCLTCGNPIYDGRMRHCSKKCKRIWKRKRNKQPKYYFDDETGEWEILNANSQ